MTSRASPPDGTDQLRHSVDRLERQLAGVLAQVDPAAGAAARKAAEDFEARRGALTPREREVLDLVAAGWRVPEVAEQLYVSRSTVRNHLSQLFRRFGVAGQAELLDLVRRAGWRPGTPPAPDRPEDGAARPVPPERLALVLDLVRRAAQDVAHARRLLDAAERGDEARGGALERLASLSPQERRVVELVADGRRAPAIAAELGLSQSTVRNHLSNVFRKVGVSSQAELSGLLHREARPRG